MDGSVTIRSYYRTTATTEVVGKARGDNIETVVCKDNVQTSEPTNDTLGIIRGDTVVTATLEVIIVRIPFRVWVRPECGLTPLYRKDRIIESTARRSTGTSTRIQQRFDTAISITRRLLGTDKRNQIL